MKYWAINTNATNRNPHKTVMEDTHIHAVGCKDISRYGKDAGYPLDADTKEGILAEVFVDFIGQDDFTLADAACTTYFFPCCGSIK